MAIFSNDSADYESTYAEEAAMIDASELIAEALEESGMTRSDLARTLGVPKSEITARLKGERNITVRKLARTLHALGAQLELNIATKPASTRKFFTQDSPIPAAIRAKTEAESHPDHRRQIQKFLEQR